eukprot:Gb_12863 [translate_table: standard]
MEAAVLQTSSQSYLVRGLAFIGNAIYELFRRCMLWIISFGPIPQHVAIIMDGNRRYANRRQMNKWSGHQFGHQSLMHTLRDCYDLGIKYVTVYAFSIENFRRTKEEVDFLMNLMHEKLESLIEKESLVRQYGIRVQLLGDLSLLPERVRKAAEKAMLVTKDNNKAVLNICAPYTSTQEIVKAVQEVTDEVITRPELRRFMCKNGNGKSDFHMNGFYQDHHEDQKYSSSEQVDFDATLAKEIGSSSGEEEIERQWQEELESIITAEEIERHLYTSNCPEPELLIRTSGETRLSNFLLWQSSLSYLYVTRTLWPEFSFKHLMMAVLQYQKVYPFLQQKQRELKRLSAHSD